jgi:signal peptidase I
MEPRPQESTLKDQPGRLGVRGASGKGFLAGSCSLLCPGVGQWMAGYPRRGLALAFAMFLALVFRYAGIFDASLAPVSWVLYLLPFAVQVGAGLNAYICGRRSDRPMLSDPARRYTAGRLVVLLGLGAWLGFYAVEQRMLHLLGVSSLRITTEAMRPTLQPGERTVAHRVGGFQRWDIVIFHPPRRQDIFTQRIAGLPGEKVEIIGSQLRINNQPQPSPTGVGPYAGHINFGPQTGCEGHPIVLGPAEYFLLCDDPAATYDSRSFPDAAPGHPVGVVPQESIIGRVTAVVWPPTRVRQLR